MLPNGYAGPLGYASAACHGRLHRASTWWPKPRAGSKTPKEAAERAEKRAAALLQGLRSRTSSAAGAFEPAQRFERTARLRAPRLEPGRHRRSCSKLTRKPQLPRPGVHAARGGCCCSLFLTYPLGLGLWLGFTDAKIGRAGALGRRWTTTNLPVRRRAWRGCRCSTRSSTRSVASVIKFALGLWLAILLNQNICRSSPSCAPWCCCPSSCPRRCRRSPSGGSTTRSSRSSPGCW